MNAFYIKHREFLKMFLITFLPSYFLVFLFWLYYKKPEPAKDCEPQLKHFEIKVISEGNYTATPVYKTTCKD